MFLDYYNAFIIYSLFFKLNFNYLKQLNNIINYNFDFKTNKDLLNY